MRHAIDDKLFGFFTYFCCTRTNFAPACPEVPEDCSSETSSGPLRPLPGAEKGFLLIAVVISIAAYVPKYLMSYVLLLAGALLITLPLRLPLRVLALVLVRCPLTGNPRRWRSPR